MDYAGFFVAVDSKYDHHEFGTVNGDLVGVLGRKPTGSMPDSDMVWQGVMVGTWVEGGGVLQGDAELLFDAHDSTLDASFFNIENIGKLDKLAELVRGLPHNCIVFRNVPLDKFGSYSRFTTEDDERHDSAAQRGRGSGRAACGVDSRAQLRGAMALSEHSGLQAGS